MENENPGMRRRAVGALVLATGCWGLSFPLMKSLVVAQQQVMPAASVWFITAETSVVRFALAAVLMALWCGRGVLAVTAKEVELGVGLGVFAGVGTLFQMVGLQDTLASTSAFLTQFYVLILPWVVAVHRRRWPSALLLACSPS